MGQKTNPKSLRLISTQSHLSQWHSPKPAYKNLIKEDWLIREKLQNALKTLLTIANIKITRHKLGRQEKEDVHIRVYALHPEVNLMQKKVLSFFDLQQNLPIDKAIINSLVLPETSNVFAHLILEQTTTALLRNLTKKNKKNYNLDFVFIKNTFDNATLIAKYIVGQLEKRVPFRRTIKQVIKNAQYLEKNGVKIQVSGRLNGIDIARSEWKREGKIPLHTLNVAIDYAHEEAKTIFGIIGVKVWLYN